MKKICILIFTLMSSILGFSQLLEVKGVETKLVVYDGPEYEVLAGKSGSGSYRYKYFTKWFGYSFYNMNSIPVSVEAELYETHELLVTTKTFNLKPGETYVWKNEHIHSFKVNYNRNPDSYNDYTKSREVPGGGSVTYYVRYKAYKIL